MKLGDLSKLTIIDIYFPYWQDSFPELSLDQAYAMADERDRVAAQELEWSVTYG